MTKFQKTIVVLLVALVLVVVAAIITVLAVAHNANVAQKQADCREKYDATTVQYALCLTRAGN